MKCLFFTMVLALPACTTVAPRVPLEAAVAATSARTLGTFSITGAELQQTGRMELPDALRASSPIFH
jgi:hypothetical protein